MSMKQPAGIQSFPDVSIEKIAYRAVETIPVRELNDRLRLGYSVWQYVSGKIPTLREAIDVARVRLLVTEDEAYAVISRKLLESGINRNS